MKTNTSGVLLGSISVGLILCGIIALFSNSKTLNNFIFGICLFTLMYALSDYSQTNKWKYFFMIYSIPLAIIGTLIMIWLRFDNLTFTRINNSLTLITLGITIFLISDRESKEQMKLLEMVLDKKTKNDAEPNELKNDAEPNELNEFESKKDDV